MSMTEDKMLVTDYSNYGSPAMLTRNYTKPSAEATYLGESYYATLIVKATNPLLQTFANKFKEFEENVNNKIS